MTTADRARDAMKLAKVLLGHALWIMFLFTWTCAMFDSRISYASAACAGIAALGYRLLAWNGPKDSA